MAADRIVLREAEAVQPPSSPNEYWPILRYCEWCLTAEGAEPRQFYTLVREWLYDCKHCSKKITD